MVQALLILLLVIWEIGFLINIPKYNDTTRVFVAVLLMILPFGVIYFIRNNQKRKQEKSMLLELHDDFDSDNYTEHPFQAQVLQATKKDMLVLQQLILPGQNKLIMSLSDLEKHSQSAISRYSDIVDDCNYLIGTTENPETFFTRYSFLLDTLHTLKSFEPFFHFEGYIPSQQLDYNISVKQVRIQELANRLYNKALIKADSLKTEKGKQNQFIKAYDSLMIYKSEMTKETILHIKEKFGTKFEINKSTDVDFYPINTDPLFNYSYELQDEADIDL